VGTNFPPVQIVPGDHPASCKMGYRVFPGGKVRPERAADHSPPSSAAVMEEYSYTSTHPLGHTGPVTGKLYLYFTFSSILCVLSFLLLYFDPFLCRSYNTQANELNISGVPRNFVRVGGVQQIQLRTERTGIWGRCPLLRRSASSCNWVQEISFHIVKFS